MLHQIICNALISFSCSADDGRPRICSTLCHGRENPSQPRVFRLFQTPHGALLHNGNKLLEKM